MYVTTKNVQLDIMWIFTRVYNFKVTLKMNSEWAPLEINQNWYSDKPLVKYAYYATIKCSTKVNAINVKPTRERLLVILINFLCPSVSISVDQSC